MGGAIVALMYLGLFALALGVIVAVLEGRLGEEETDDPFDRALASMDHLEAEAWRAIEELRRLDSDGSE
jgi:hypothetical protein